MMSEGQTLRAEHGGEKNPARGRRHRWMLSMASIFTISTVVSLSQSVTYLRANTPAVVCNQCEFTNNNTANTNISISTNTSFNTSIINSSISNSSIVSITSFNNTNLNTRFDTSTSSNTIFSNFTSNSSTSLNNTFDTSANTSTNIIDTSTNTSNNETHNSNTTLATTTSKVVPSTVEKDLDTNLSTTIISVDASNTTALSCAVGLRFYVYPTDNLPYDMTAGLEQKVQQFVDDGTVSIHESAYTELLLLKLFRSSPCRTYNPAEAHLFIVPYMHAADCMLNTQYVAYCGFFNEEGFKLLTHKLEYFNKSDINRHVFLTGWGEGKTHRRVREKTIALTPGPLGREKRHVLIPLAGPKDPHDRDPLSWKSLHNRTYSVSYHFGGRNWKARGNTRRFREFFYNTVQHRTTLGGKPMSVHMKSRNDPRAKIDGMSLYQDSIFCPVLPGDSPWQKRFFDVIHGGCIPVVLEWFANKTVAMIAAESNSLINTSSSSSLSSASPRSWFQPASDDPRTNMFYQVSESYPFHPETFKGQQRWTVDYDSFVLRIPAHPRKEDNVTAIADTMERYLTNDMQNNSNTTTHQHQQQHFEDVVEKQRRMQRYSRALQYIDAPEAHMKEHDNAFLNILRALQYQYEDMYGNITESNGQQSSQ